MALVSSYDALLFDYGGVLVSNQSDEDQARMAEFAGIPKQQFTDLYWSDRLDYDKGLIGYTDYWQMVASRAGRPSLASGSIEQLVEMDVLSWMQFDSIMWDWIGQLRAAGKRVAMLSNMPRELGEALKLRTARLESFDHVTLSYEVHAVKPESAIYEHCLEGLGVSAERAIFLDDRIVNVEAAENLGIRSIQFTCRDDVLTALRG